MVWYFHLLKNFPQFVVIHTVKGFGEVNKSEDFFLNSLAVFMIQKMWQFDLWFLCLFYIQLEHLEVHSSCTVEALLEEF